MSEVLEPTPAKQRGRKGAGRRATRSTAKLGRAAAATDDDTIAEEHDAQPLQSQPANMQPDSQQQDSQQQDVTAVATSQRRRQPAMAATAAQPATSSITANTARQSGRLGSRLTGAHAAIPAGSTSTAHEDDAASESDVKPEKTPGAAPWASACRHAADVAITHAKHAWAELRAGRITPQLAAAIAAMLLLWLAASSVGSWHAAASMRSNIAALSQALDGSRSHIAALQQQLDGALSQQNGQHSSQQEVQRTVQQLQKELQSAKAATGSLHAQYAAQQAQWEGVVKNLQAQHSSQQQQWERDLAQLQLEMGATGQPSAAAVPGDEAAAAQHWSRIRDSVFLHMRRVLDSFAADRTGRPDFALASAGGRVVGHSMLAGGGQPRWAVALQRATRLVPGGLLPFVHPHADEYLLSPTAGLPGRCLALNGSTGHVDIRLRTAIQPEAVTLEHVPRAIAFDTSSAAHQVAVLGFQGQPGAQGTGNSTTLLTFAYDLAKGPVQTFPVKGLASGSFDHVRFQVISNHGNPEYTCLYRLRVHGSPASGT